MAVSVQRHEGCLTMLGTDCDAVGLAARALDDKPHDLLPVVFGDSVARAGRDEAPGHEGIGDLRPHADQCVKRPRQVPIAAARSGQVPVYEGPPFGSRDQVPWREVVVTDDLRSAGWIGSDVLSDRAGGRHKGRHCVVIAPDKACDRGQRRRFRQQVLMVGVDDLALHEGQHLAPAHITAQRLRGCGEANRSQVAEKGVYRISPWASRSKHRVA